MEARDTENSEKITISLDDAKNAVRKWAETNGGPVKAKDALATHFGVKLSEIREDQAAAIFCHFTGREVSPAEVAEWNRQREEQQAEAQRARTAIETNLPAHLHNVPRKLADAPRWRWGYHSELTTLSGLAEIPSKGREACFVCGDGWVSVAVRGDAYGRRDTGAEKLLEKALRAYPWLAGGDDDRRGYCVYCADLVETSNLFDLIRETKSYSVWGRENWEEITPYVEFNEGYHNGGYPLDASADLRKLLDSDSTPAQRFAATFREVPALREPVELIPGVLRQGENLIVGGVAKAHKTAALADMAVSLADGGDFLGAFPVREGCPVLYVSCETKQPTFELMLRRMREAKGVEDTGRLHVRYTVPNLQDPDIVESVAGFANDIGAGAIVFDPASKILRGLDNAANLFATSAALAPLDRIEELTGATIILAHHLRSLGQDKFRKPDLRDLSQAGFSEWARQWLLLNHSEDYRPGVANLWMVCGHATHASEHRLAIDCGRPLWSEYSVAVVDAKPSAGDTAGQGGDADLAAVLSCLSDDEFLSVDAIRKAAHRSHQRAKLALNLGVSRGQVEVGATGRGAVGYRLRQGAAGLATPTNPDQASLRLVGV